MDKMNEKIIEEIKRKGLCKDNFVGTIAVDKCGKINKDLHFLKEERNMLYDKDKINRFSENDDKNIVIVLESPHKNEFENEYGMIAPALGRTGANLKREIEEIFIKKLPVEENQKYNLILMNGVQYQCSNGESLIKYRDRTNEIWKYFWLDYEKEAFSKRIKLYNPYIVINACTGDVEKKKSIKFILQESITDCCVNSKLYISPHPSSHWFQHRYVKIYKV